MILSNGIVLLSEESLAAYNSPVITVAGQQSSSDNPGIVNLTVEVRSADGSSALRTSINLSTDSVKAASESNNVNGAGLIDNLYTLLEQLLKLQLESINPNATFEIN